MRVLGLIPGLVDKIVGASVVGGGFFSLLPEDYGELMKFDGAALHGVRRPIFHQTLVDHAIQFRALRLEPGTVPIRSFAAADSRARGLPVIDWAPLTDRLLGVETVPDTDHLDIVLSPHLHDRIAALTAPAAEAPALSPARAPAWTAA